MSIGYQWLPKLDEDLSEMSYFIKMHRGEVKGFFLFGQNPAVSGPNARLQRDAMRKLQWLVAFDLFETESASVWYADPEGPDPRPVPTEVFLLPAAAITEKDGIADQHRAPGAVARTRGQRAGRLPLAICGMSTSSASG